MNEPVWERPLKTLDRTEWEALCDGCGKCCLHKIEDEDSGRIYPTNVACKLLDRHSAQCMDYRRRKAFVPDCLRLNLRLMDDIEWLTARWAYKLSTEERGVGEGCVCRVRDRRERCSIKNKKDKE